MTKTSALDLDVVDEAEGDEVEPQLGVDHLLERLVDVLFGGRSAVEFSAWTDRRLRSRVAKRLAMALLVLLFIVLPIAELYVIIQVGQAIGLVPTLAILIARRRARLGARCASRAARPGSASTRRSTERRFPGREVADGVMIIVGGALLLTPGFITDIFGLALLIPPTRAVIRGVVCRASPGARMAAASAPGASSRTARGRGPAGPAGPGGPAARGRHRGSRTYEGTAERGRPSRPAGDCESR